MNSTFFFVIGIVGIVMVISLWKIFQKAGEEGWKAIIPIYNVIVLLKIVGKPWWWLFLFIIPIVNYVFGIWTYNMLSKSFGKTEGFTVGLVLLSIVFLPILAFGDAVYQGPYGDATAFQQYNNKGSFDFDDKVVQDIS